jgi:ankyrin repeat protein
MKQSNDTPLLDAASNNLRDLVRALIAKGANINHTKKVCSLPLSQRHNNIQTHECAHC